MNEHDGTRDAAIPGASDLPDSIRGLQSVVSRKENERQAALTEAAEARADAQQARAELNEARALLETAGGDSYMDPTRAPKQRYVQSDPLANISWGDIGLPDR
jgi:hypothetical protein